MNTKKNKSKNKPRPVPVNPNLSQTHETNVGKPENIEEEKKQDVIKSEERVPEIISESVRPSIEEKDPGFDAPKKPKRNRGKKKTTDKTGDEEFIESKDSQVINDETIISVVKEDQKAESSKQETKILPQPTITPSTRKKKNKNKTHSESEEMIPSEIEKTEVSSPEILVKDPFEVETKAPKKKNKKKKRNDSEKADNIEEVISCTAAFQKILEPRDDKKELKKEDKVNEPNKPVEMTNIVSTTELLTNKEIEKKNKKKKQNNSEKSDKVDEMIASTATFQNMSDDDQIDQQRKDEEKETNESVKKPNLTSAKNVEEKDMKSNEEVNIPNKSVVITNPEYAIMLPDSKIEKVVSQNVDDEKIVEQTKEESKSKKKNKKGKMQLLKEDIEEESKEYLNLQVLEHSQEKQLETKQSENPAFETSTSFGKDCAKSKVKIAKPVEKKHKNDERIVMTTASIICEKNYDAVDQISAITKSDEETHAQTNLEKSTDDTKTDKEITRIEALQAPKAELEKIIRKSPKPSQSGKIKMSAAIKNDKLETSIVPSESGTFKNLRPEIKAALKSDLETPELSLVTEDFSTQPKSRDALAKSEKHIFLKTETSTYILESECKPEPTQPKDDSKSKNKKKSPKMSKKLETVEKSETKNFESIKEDNSEETKGEKCIDTPGSPSLTPSLEDVEITSVKTEESEGSVSDIVPDVQYPRASSLDKNNNVVIHDITTEFTEKHNVPINVTETPLITGSGETPISTPEVVSSGLSVTEVKTKTLNTSEEKTDLKSKVMEVNKDMEDLRLSIEKSLAGLTALEKSEQELEKSFEDSHNETNIMKTEAKHESVAPMKKEQIVEEIQTKPPNPSLDDKTEGENTKLATKPIDTLSPPVCPARKDNKGKGKNKKKAKQELEQKTTICALSSTTAECSVVTENTTVSHESKDPSKEKVEQSDQKTEQDKGKQKSDLVVQGGTGEKTEFEAIENFEDAMTSSADDINKTFELIANDENVVFGAVNDIVKEAAQNHPQINVTAPIEDDEKPDDDDKVNPVSQPKNLLGHPDIPVRLNKTDYKKEKHKTPNARQAKVKVKDSEPIDKESKESQTEFKRQYLKDKSKVDDTVNCTISENEEFVYKYSFRKVFLPSACHVCKKELKQARVPCSYCNLVFYCSPKHKDDDYAQHQGFCFAVSTIAHLKNQKHIYADAQDITGHDYRLLRMQMIISCEKVIKRKLTPCEQEIMLYPRICADVGCREWRQMKLKDCDGCGQISFCIDRPDHFPKNHQRWCKSYALYQKLVIHQQTLGRLEPRLPGKVMTGSDRIPDKINEVLASMYEEKIDMNDSQYASLTQIATAPLTAAYCQQLYTNKMNSTYANGVHKKSTYTLHVVGAELQFEADALNKWEVFFLHLRPDIIDLSVVLIGHDLNPSNLPLDLLGKIRLCENCRQNKRRVIFDFQAGKSYQEYWSTDYITPDLVCAFNPSVQRSSIYNGRDHWASAIKCILKHKVPFVVTAYTLIELHRDLARIKEVSDIEVNVISEPNYNNFASVRPDRNFISDDEMPLLFKNYCFMLISGAL